MQQLLHLSKTIHSKYPCCIVETNGLNPGFHRLSYRIMNELGKWSHSESRIVYILPNIEQTDVLSGGEYFFDNDPGIGNGIQFSLEETDTINIEQLVDFTGLTEGFYKLSVRVFNENKTFSHSESRLFYITKDPVLTETANPLVSMEYCIDDTLGNGNEIPVSITEGDTIDVILNLPMTDIEAGSHTIAFRVRNAEGTFSNSATDTFHVKSVVDLPRVPPTPPLDITVACSSNVPPLSDLTAVDDHDGDITVSPVDETTPGDCPNKFTVLRIWTFIDSNGNSASISQTITVFDNQPPVLSSDVPKDLTLSCGSDIPPPVNLTAVDNCDGEITVSPTINTTPGDCPNHFSEERTWTFQDACGNITIIHQNISVADNIPPVAQCNDTTVQLDESGIADISASDINNGSNDLCGNTFLSLNINSFSCNDIGNRNVILSVTDECENSSQCEAVVTVTDNIPPEISCTTPISFYVDANQNYYTVPGTDLDASATDACGIVL